MDAVDEIQLPPVGLEELPGSPDNPDLNSTSNLPTISTDDLPITPLRNKRWLNNISDIQKASISLNLTPTSISPTKSEDNDKSPYVENLNSSYNLTLPNTDNLLDINVPKITLLGKEQAKKRLHAFSLSKQNSLNISPLNKKKNLREPKYFLQATEDKYNENGEKTDPKLVLIKRPARKNVNPNEKAKAVIEEIEEMKKIESAYLEALEQGLLDQRHRRSRSKSRSRERSKRRNSRKEHKKSRSVEIKPRKTWEKPKYPANWTELINKGYNWETLLDMKPKELKIKDNEPFDFRKLLLFQTPSLPLHRLTIKTITGKERIIPPEFIRFTNKSPRISYSTKEKMPNDLYTRKCVLQYVPKSYQQNIKRIANNSVLIDAELPIKATNRKWFPKTILSKSEERNECKILETSLGLSFLQTYSDGDEQEKEMNEDEEKLNKVEEEEMKVEEESKILESEEEIEERVSKHEKEKKRKKKEKKKEKSKPKKQKHKTKKKKIIKATKREKINKKRKNSTADDDKKKQPEPENKKSDDTHKSKTDEAKETKSTTKNKARSSSKEEKSEKNPKPKTRTNSEGEQRKTDADLNKSDNSSIKKHSKHNKTEELPEKRANSPYKPKNEIKHKSRSISSEKKPKIIEKPPKIKSPELEPEPRKIKCVAEKEFGTPDTEEYYSNWESDVELTNSEKTPGELLNESTSINQSWQSDEDQLDISTDIPLVKSPFRDDQSSPISPQNKEQTKRTYKRDKSVEKRRPSLRDRSLSPLRSTRSRHLDSFPLSPIQNELRSSPTQNDFSPFRNRIEERRRSRRSMERSPEKFLEMPLNIRNTRYSRKPWEEERFDGKYNRSPEHVENKVYALYSEDAWERDDYLTIKSEEMKLEEERRTLIEERRKLEIERRKFQEMERQRYYNRMTEFDEKRCGFEERRQEEFKTSDDEDKRYRPHRDYRETREHPQYSKENDVPSRRSSEDQRSRRRYTPDRLQELQRERMRDSFNWEDTETKRTEKEETNKKRRKSRWQNLDDLEPLHQESEHEGKRNDNEGNKSEPVLVNKPEHKSYGKEKKISKKNRWESSEDEIIIRDDKKSAEKIPNKQEQHKKLKDVNKYKERRDKDYIPTVNREKNKRTYKREDENKSLTDNLDLPPRKPISRPSSIKKPEVLENEYEKFMQALGSEISTTEEISEKEFQEQKRKTKPIDKRIKKRKSYSRSVSISSDEEEFEKHSTREIRKRKVKKRVSSSSSSSTSSSSSGSDSSTDSSSLSSSSEVSSEEEKKKLKKRKIEAVKVKMEDRETQKKSQTELKPHQANMGNIDVLTVNRMKEKGTKEIIKIEDPNDKPNSNTRLIATPNKIVGANLNIINLTIPDFTLGPIPLPNNEALKALKASETPQPVPSPKLSLITSNNDTVLQKIEPIITKIEPIVLTLPKTEPEMIATTPILSEIAPVPPVTQLLCSINDLNTSTDNICAIKEEPTTPEDQKFETNPDILISPTKRNNLIPIKFLTAELRKQASESSNLKPLAATTESKDSIPTLIDIKTNIDKNDPIDALPLTNRKRHFAMSSINLPAKRPLLEGSENEENSTDFTDKFIRKDENMDEVSTSSAQFIETIESRNLTAQRQSPKFRERSFEPDRTSKDRRKQRSISPRRKRNFSPRRRDSRSPRRHDSPRRWSRDVSPRRRERELSPRGQRMSSPGRWDRNGSPRRGSSRDRSTRRSRDDLHRRNSTSPGQKDRRDHRSISPGIKTRHRSPSLKRRSMSREFSPRRHRSKDRSSSKDSKLESIQETLQRIAGVDKYCNRMKHSPISSPLHGFKRSVADSTISDDQLLQHNSEEYIASPSYNNTTEFFKNTVTHSPSPKRMSLDERISQALGLAADQQPKPISTTYSANYECDPQYFDQYGQYYEQYGEQNQKSGIYGQSDQCYNRQTRQRENSNLKVVQVGNVLQVVPIEDAPPKPPPVQQNKITNSTQKIVQVGNMLQIVPTATLPEIPVEVPVVPLPLSAPPTPTPPVTSIKDPLNAETLIKQKAERRAEKDKRRQEREKKRKEKEKKRKEREKRKQFKVKMQTEAMIKQALIRETEEEVPPGNEENLNLETTGECQAPIQWPPVPQIVCNNLYKPAGKGILSRGSRGNQNEEVESKRKTVKFSDGVMPGEGTSPSGGEELSSPPPAPKKLPKEKRFIKTKVPKKVKVPKKKKVKVKVIRQQQTQGTEEDDEDEDDNLPPPPPPPGSPPPHIFPARIKQPIINNIHPNIVVSIANQPLQPTNTSFPPPSVYRPPQPPVIMSHHHGHHHGPPHLPLHGHGHHHHPPPCPPPHHGGLGFNPPTVVVPPVISVVPSIPSVVAPCYPPQHNHHHHHGGHHPHHSPHHHGHHHH